MQKKTLQLIFLVMISSLLLFCKSKKVNDDKMNDKDKITITSKENTTKIYSEDKSKILILNFTTNTNPIITYNYKVIDAKTKLELKKGVFVGEKIEWLDNTSLKCTPHIGMIEKESNQVLEGNKSDNTQYIIIKID